MSAFNHGISAVLAKYLPEETVPICTKWIVQLNIHLRITKDRSSKFGDYRPVHNGKAHVITVNHNLNRYAFLITFVHEVAHLVCEIKYSRFISPHGKEWKQEYAILLKYFLSKNIFPEDIANALKRYIHSPAASSCTDHHLMRVLKKHDGENHEGTIHLEQLKEGSLFRLRSHASEMIFKKGKKARTRYLCVEINSGKEYMVSGIAEIKEVQNAANNHDKSF